MMHDLPMELVKGCGGLLPDCTGGWRKIFVRAFVICQLVMLLWSYFAVVCTDPGGVPPNWRPAVDEERGESDPLASVQQPGEFGVPMIQYCRKCNQQKPPRYHHCSVCGMCILKMDHHCVWVVNCVGALNYKFFILFLVRRDETTSIPRLDRVSTWKTEPAVAF